MIIIVVIKNNQGNPGAIATVRMNVAVGTTPGKRYAALD
jgi:hypothetical protein